MNEKIKNYFSSERNRNHVHLQSNPRKRVCMRFARDRNHNFFMRTKFIYIQCENRYRTKLTN